MIDLQVERDGPLTIVRMIGDLSGTDVETAGETLAAATDAADARVVIDLSETKTIDSSGLGELMSCVTKARLRGGEVVLLAPTPFVSGVLNVTRLDHWFEIHDTLDAARRRFDVE